MKDAGIKLVYSMPQIKVHSKTAMVKKKVAGMDKSYAILSTGNFNEITAQFYTDHVLMTSNAAITNELELLFEFLQNGHTETGDTGIKFKELLVSQFNMTEELEKYIDGEIKKAGKGEPARIRIKVNNLEDPNIIGLLYKAGNAGVNVELIIRSICCIVTDIPGISEHITVRRIVDHFLEHTRLFIFGTGEETVVIIGSADLMTRNLHHRIEVCVPLRDIRCRKELLDYFEIQWSDNSKSVQLLPDLRFTAVDQLNGHSVNAQQNIYAYLKNKI